MTNQEVADRFLKYITLTAKHSLRRMHIDADTEDAVVLQAALDQIASQINKEIDAVSDGDRVLPVIGITVRETHMEVDFVCRTCRMHFPKSGSVDCESCDKAT